MAIVSGSLQSTSATALTGAADIWSVPTNNEMSANVLAGPVSVLVPVPATGYKGLRLTYTIPQLDKMNYVDWAAKTENLLEIQGVWDIISSQYTQPRDGSSAEITQVSRCNNGIALAIISNSVEATEYPAIQNIRHAAKAWSKL